MAARRAPTSSRFPRSRTAVLIVDVINAFDFPGGHRLAPRALHGARHIAGLAARARRAGVPVIFVNDNLGRWRSNVDALITSVEATTGADAALTSLLRPQPADFVVLKSTLSGFYETPLHAMLQLGQVRTVVVTGLLTGSCVLLTAADAYMRNYRVIVPSDCVVDRTDTHQRGALATMADVLKARVVPARQIRLLR